MLLKLGWRELCLPVVVQRGGAGAGGSVRSKQEKGGPEASGKLDLHAICIGPALLQSRIVPAFFFTWVQTNCPMSVAFSPLSNPSSKLISSRDLSLVSLAVVSSLPQDQSVLYV